jgi:hypothetical protein
MENMGDLTDSVTTENGSGQKKRDRRWIFADFVKKGVLAALALSLLIMAVYMAGSIPDPGFSDRLLFLLLRLLRYASLLLCAFSFFALGFSVHHMVYYPCVRNALSLSFYFFTGIMGAGFAMLNSMIIAAAGGNG